jgi:addiction module HigA family antidote
MRTNITRIRTHPGDVLREEYLVPLGLSARALAKSLAVPENRITEIMRGERDVTAEVATGRPSAVRASRKNPWIVEKNFNIQVIQFK